MMLGQERGDDDGASGVDVNRFGAPLITAVRVRACMAPVRGTVQ
jgi:hypothetical protein